MKKTKETIRYFLLVCAVVMLCIEAVLAKGNTESLIMPDLKEYRIERSISEEAQKCIDCHSKLDPGIVADWSDGRHAHANITCLDCHEAGAADADVSVEHLELTKTRISAIVSPKDCSRCHPQEAAQYSKSKHANTLEIVWKIDPWMREGMNNTIERRIGCYHC
ncbi:MAG: multiheme c-type cytochrome, partial [Sedimentisphaerales bacterium]|nr:multiheme c-type cytochrome [Sedimentisphaerales bacterium]